MFDDKFIPVVNFLSETLVLVCLNVEDFQFVRKVGTLSGPKVLGVIFEPHELIPPGIFYGWVVVELHDGRGRGRLTIVCSLKQASRAISGNI